MVHIVSVCLALLILLSSCSQKTGDNWYETADGSIVYSICFFKYTVDLTAFTDDARKYRDNVIDKLERIEALKCRGLNIKIPKKNIWNDRTKMLSRLGAFVIVSRDELGLTPNTSNKESSKDLASNRGIGIKINEVRWFEDNHDASMASLNGEKKAHKYTSIPDIENGFKVYKITPTQTYYTPALNKSDIFIHCGKIGCLARSNVNDLLHIEYGVYREDVPNIRVINKKISNYLKKLYSVKANRAIKSDS